MGHMDMGVDLRVVSCSRDSCSVFGAVPTVSVEGLGTTTFDSENHNGFVYYTNTFFFFFLKRIHHINNNAVPW